MSAFQLGLDRSGNANHFNAINVVETDRVIDTPTNNFSVLNNLHLGVYDPDSLTYPAGNPTYSEGNLQVVTPNNGAGVSVSTIGVESGKWYAEVYLVAFTSLQRSAIAITGDAEGTILAATNIGSLTTSLDVGYFFNGTKFVGNSEGASAGATYAVGDVMGIALNVDDSEVTFYKNNSSQFTQAFTAGGTYHFAHGDVSAGGGVTNVYNFGQDSSFAGRKTPGNKQDGNSIGDFFYAPPAGFLALCTENLPEPTVVDPGEYFNTVLYTGNGNDNRAITGVGFQPDWVWIKGRNNGESTWHDSIRGAANGLFAESETAEDTGGNLVSFDSNGFTTSDSNRANANSRTLAAWCWRAGGGAASVGSNTDGSINTTDTSVNSEAGISISTFTGNATSGATVGHGLGVVPEWMMVICRSSAGNRQIYHASNTAAPQTDVLHLEVSGATADVANIWNDTAPTSSVFSLGNNAAINGNNETFVAYCFHSVEGFSKFGGYTGKGKTNGIFIHTGFRPAWLMIRRTDTSADWLVFDNKRSPSNPVDDFMEPNTTDNEATESSSGYEIDLDFVSNGFKLRGPGGGINGAAGNFVYFAFAEAPFKYANGR